MLKVGRFTEKQSQALQHQLHLQHQGGGSNNAAHAVPPREAGVGHAQDARAFTAGVDGDPAFNPFTYATTDPANTAPSAGGTGTTSTVLVNGFPLSGERPATGMGGGGHLHSAKVAFKSKVVSRAHAEIWCEAGGNVSANRLGQCSCPTITFGPEMCDLVLCEGHKVVFGDVFESHPALKPRYRVSAVPYQGTYFSDAR